MKTSLFFVSEDYLLLKSVATNVAGFFAMRIFDSTEMFEFDNSPRTIDEVFAEYDKEYAEKEFCGTIKMGLDFDEVAIVFDARFLQKIKSLYKKISAQCLVVYLKTDVKTTDLSLFKLDFLASACDIAVDAKKMNVQQISERVVDEIKAFYELEA